MSADTKDIYISRIAFDDLKFVSRHVGSKKQYDVLDLVVTNYTNGIGRNIDLRGLDFHVKDVTEKQKKIQVRSKTLRTLNKTAIPSMKMLGWKYRSDPIVEALNIAIVTFADALFPRLFERLQNIELNSFKQDIAKRAKRNRERDTEQNNKTV